MAVTDWTLTRGTYVIGSDAGGLKVAFVRGAFPNIFDVPTRSNDTEFQGKDGAHVGIETRGALLLSFAWRIVSAAKDADAVMDNAALARTAFAPVSTANTITVVAPGSRSLVYTGHPRNLIVDDDDVDLGVIVCRASFYVPTGVATSGTL